MRKFSLSVFIFLLFFVNGIFSQREITVDHIWKYYSFYSSRIDDFNFQNDGQHFTRLINGRIVQYNILSGSETQVLFESNNVPGFLSTIDDYSFSESEDKILLKTETERIYRHSTRADFYVWDIKAEKLQKVFNSGKQQYSSFDPLAKKVAFVYDNNLYFKDLSSEKITQITTDGKYNNIINGGTDWVYEEEFSMSKAFEWSPDGKKIAFLRFNESEVKEFTLQIYNDDLYPENVSFKYPKVGEKNASVSVFIYNIESGKTVPVLAEGMGDSGFYFPRIKWTNNPDKLVVFKMNRHQNRLELLLADAETGKTSILLKEKNKYYIDIHDNLTFLKDEKHFIWTSEKDGWNHIYLYDMHGKVAKQITKGEWEVTDFYGIDEEREEVFYQSTEGSHLERQVYVKGIWNKKKHKLSAQNGWNSAQFSSTFDYFISTFSTANSPTVYTVYDRSGKYIRTIEDNAEIALRQKEFGVTKVEFFDFKTSDNVKLYGWMIKPPDFKPDRQYPVMMYLYGGPGSQEVTNQWHGQNYWWHQMLAQKGYIVACVDNRGTGGRGEKFKKMTYMQLGKYETIDQIEAAKHLGSLPYTNSSRIGIWGWSYGGYMSSLCVLKGNDVFDMAISVAPVTNWKWYDSIYTERFMRTEQENPEGFRENSPVYFADLLKGKYLLIHGTGDDNVHFQNTIEMVNALIAADKHFDVYFYPNRNHGIYGGNTRSHLFKKMTQFIYDNL